MPLVSNEYGVKYNENDSETSYPLPAFIQILDSSHCKFGRLVGRVILLIELKYIFFERFCSKPIITLRTT